MPSKRALRMKYCWLIRCVKITYSGPSFLGHLAFFWNYAKLQKNYFGRDQILLILDWVNSYWFFLWLAFMDQVIFGSIFGHFVNNFGTQMKIFYRVNLSKQFYGPRSHLKGVILKKEFEICFWYVMEEPHWGRPEVKILDRMCKNSKTCNKLKKKFQGLRRP